MGYILFVAVVVGVWGIIAYNKLQGLMQANREHLSNLQAALKKRLDLANQIVDIATGYCEHEKLSHLTLSNNLGSLDKIRVLAQSYPALRANETFQVLMEQLERLEQNILKRREAFNLQVRNYNSYRNSFPVVLVASRLSFDTAPYFDMNDEDFADRVKVFQRDDTEALQNAIAAGANAVKSSASTARRVIADRLNNPGDKPID